jgi:hypothetical protein
MKHSIRAVGAAASLAAGGLVAVVAANPAHAQQICDQWGSTVVQRKYVVQNNRWKGSNTQCINVTETPAGFTITTQQNVMPTSGPPASYPNIYIGCRYDTCSPNSFLPMQVKSMVQVTSGLNYTYGSDNAIFDASYDIWFDPQPKKTGVNQLEVMIWLNHQGSIQPVGKSVGEVTLRGQKWIVWSGWNGENDVISYVAPSAIPSFSFNVRTFYDDVRKRYSKLNDDYYLTSIQAGFEPWQGGVGLKVQDFVALQ